MCFEFPVSVFEFPVNAPRELPCKQLIGKGVFGRFGAHLAIFPVEPGIAVRGRRARSAAGRGLGGAA